VQAISFELNYQMVFIFITFDYVPYSIMILFMQLQMKQIKYKKKKSDHWLGGGRRGLDATVSNGQ